MNAYQQHGPHFTAPGMLITHGLLTHYCIDNKWKERVSPCAMLHVLIVPLVDVRC